MEQIRSFIAIELPDGLKSELARLKARLESEKQPWVKWVDPFGIHLTLKFLGSIGVDKTNQITEAIEKAAQGISPFRLVIKDLGVFPNLKRAQVAWVGISGELDKLIHLQRRIESCLVPLNFAPEIRTFKPHLTLARLRDRTLLEERQRFGQLIADTGFRATSTIDVDSINLMRSQLTREGAIYSRISSVELKGSHLSGKG